MFGVVISIIICCAFGIFDIVFLIIYFSCPFKFPYKRISFDITSKRQPQIIDYIDQYLIDNGLQEINNALENFKHWKTKCDRIVNKSIFRNHRHKQLLKVLDENRMFIFIFFRNQTRYKQVKYVRSSYKVKREIKSFCTNYEFLQNRFNMLEKIDFACILSDYEKKDQRRLMTKELRERIALRDNFTCQMCGKYMPDSVGLHIDHIIPISKGGKSIPSNLQVLCSKCNGTKSSNL